MTTSAVGTVPTLLLTTRSARWKRHSAWIVLVVGLLLSAAATLTMRISVEAFAKGDFLTHCDEFHNEFSARLDDHARILLSGAALFNTFDEVVTREAWHRFTQHQKIERQLPGIQGIGFSLLIPRAELPRHIQEIRQEGFPEYQVKPEGEREVYSSVIYLEPFSERNLRAFGYDMLTESVRRAAMERARDTNSAALSGKVVLVQETGPEAQAGTLMYVPVYRPGWPLDSLAQRQAAIAGWVYSPYRMNDLLRGILGDRNLEKDKKMHLALFDGAQPSPPSLLYACHPAEHDDRWPSVRFTRQLPLDFNGHRWTLRFTQTGGAFFTAEYTKVWLTLIGGMLITLLLFALIRALLNTGVTAQRIAEELTVDLRKVNCELEAAMVQTRELAVQAQAANAAKGRFLATMSHEIRTPLNAILGFSQLLQRDPKLALEQQQRVATINRSGEHLLALLNEILEFSKIEAGQQALVSSAFDLPGLLRELATLFRPQADAKQLTLRLDGLDDVERYLVADERKLRQILMHLLGNAVKFTTTGGVWVRVSTEPQGTEDLRLVLLIGDSGPGIAAAEIGRLFAPFEQGAAGCHSCSGTGLGLAISRQLARLMGGDLTVTSEFGQGSVFRLEVPAQPATESLVATELKGSPVQSGLSDVETPADQSARATAEGSPARTRELLNSLPAELRAQLHAAALRGRQEQLRQALQQVADPELRRQLLNLVAKFDYEPFLQLHETPLG